MPVSPFFNNYNNKEEQGLVDDIINESINIMGFTGYYVPNNNATARDLLFGDDPLKKFEEAYPLATYLSNAVDPGMSGEFFSKFGLEIKNNVRVQIARREFARIVSSEPYARPKEGDLFYIPFLSGNGELYEIKFVNDAADFFAMGRKLPYYWELELELFKYSHEEINTGIDDIDIVENDSTFLIELNLGIGEGVYIPNEIVFQSVDTTFANSSVQALVESFDHVTNILNVKHIDGEFSNTALIYGETSGAAYYIDNFDLLDVPKRMDAMDNKHIETESNNIIDTSEANPFGSLF